MSLPEESCQALGKDRIGGGAPFQQAYVLWTDQSENHRHETALLPISAGVFIHRIPEQLAWLQPSGGQTDRIQDPDDLLGQALTQQEAKAWRLSLEQTG